MKGYVGSGILALPYTFDQGGYVLSSFIFLTIALIIYKTLKLLFEVADNLNIS